MFYFLLTKTLKMIIGKSTEVPSVTILDPPKCLKKQQGLLQLALTKTENYRSSPCDKSRIARVKKKMASLFLEHVILLSFPRSCFTRDVFVS